MKRGAERLTSGLETVLVVQAALERAGVEFTTGPGHSEPLRCGNEMLKYGSFGYGGRTSTSRGR